MEQAAVAKGGAEPDRQRDDIGSLHGSGVPARSACKTRAPGLTTPRPGINDGSAPHHSNTVERPM
jgi:hypothetical protein